MENNFLSNYLIVFGDMIFCSHSHVFPPTPSDEAYDVQDAGDRHDNQSCSSSRGPSVDYGQLMAIFTLSIS